MPNKTTELDNFLNTTYKKFKYSESQAFHLSGKAKTILRQKVKFFIYEVNIIDFKNSSYMVRVPPSG